jgi:uncharacterized protein with ATP-grasp and redox domains
MVDLIEFHIDNIGIYLENLTIAIQKAIDGTLLRQSFLYSPDDIFGIYQEDLEEEEQIEKQNKVNSRLKEKYIKLLNIYDNMETGIDKVVVDEVMKYEANKKNSLVSTLPTEILNMILKVE